MLKISQDLSRIRDDNEGIKALLAVSNESRFELTSNPTIQMKNNKYYICIREDGIKTQSKESMWIAHAI